MRRITCRTHRRPVVRYRPGLMRCERARPRRRRDRRVAVIHRRAKCFVAARQRLMLHLGGDGRRMALVGEAHFLFGRARGDAARAVVAHARHVVVHHDRLVVDVGDVDVGDVIDLAVVVEPMRAPITADIADADVAEAVVDAAVVADVHAPVAGVEDVGAARPAPVARRPQRAGVRRHDPGAGNPVVAADRIIGPVARRPDIARRRNRRLYVHRQRGRREIHRHEHAGMRGGRGEGERRRRRKGDKRTRKP